jgi:H+/gluconate symporter-like permease
MIETLGVVAGLILIIVLAMRGVNVFVASLLASTVIAVTNGLNLGKALTVDYTTGAMTKFAAPYFLVFVLGAIFGRIMGESKAATALAYALTRWLGEKRTLLICVIAGSVLTYGGVNVFIVIFAIYPLSLVLLQRSKIPKRLVNGAFCLGTGTFTMTALPYAPTIHNVIAAKSLGTSLGAAPWLGIAASLAMIIPGLWYLRREQKKAFDRGEFFKPAITDIIPEEEPDLSKMPHWFLSILPLLCVSATIMVPQFILLANGITQTTKELPTEGMLGFLSISISNVPLWTTLALAVGVSAALILFFPYYERPMTILGHGAESAILPLMNTAAVIGFGAVVGQTKVFSWFTDIMLESDMNPILSAAISSNIMAGIVGSASGGLGIFMETLKQHYLDAGIPPDILHRVVTIGASGLDSLPHCGAVITSFTIMGMTHREAYKDVFVITVVIPIIALVLVVALAILFGGTTPQISV